MTRRIEAGPVLVGLGALVLLISLFLDWYQPALTAWDAFTDKTGIGVVLTDASPPSVKSVGLGNLNGVTLGYTPGTGQGSATATKDGSKYKISGTATGVDMANPMQPVNKPFEIDVTCP